MFRNFELFRINDEFIGSWIGGSWSACAQACAEKDGNGRLPLHSAAEHGASVAVVGRLLQHHPHAAAVGTNRGWGLPLHLALVHKAAEGVALAIIDAHPQVRRRVAPCHEKLILAMNKLISCFEISNYFELMTNS